MENLIKTKMSPKEIRANFGRIVVSDGGQFDVTATADVFNEVYDRDADLWTLQMGLDYPGRVPGLVTVTHAIHVVQDGFKVPMKKPEHMLNQAEFDTVVKGGKITVPARP